jgi:hypothetical protein
MVLALLRIVNCVHIGSDLVDARAAISVRASLDYDVLFLLYVGLGEEFLVVAVDLEDVFGDGDQELALDGLGQVHGDVPLRDNFLVGGVPALFDAAVVVDVLKEQDTPIVRGGQTEEGEERLLLDGMDHEVDEVLRLIKGGLLRVDDDLVEVRVDHVAPMLLELVEQLEEILHHKLVDEPMEQGVIELGLCWG